MPVTIETDAHGKLIIVSELVGKKALLPAENLYMQLGTGHVFNSHDLHGGGTALDRLRPHETEMVEKWLRERAGEVTITVFAGEPAPATPEAEEATVG